MDRAFFLDRLYPLQDLVLARITARDRFIADLREIGERLLLVR
jgi:hypothetical protein